MVFQEVLPRALTLMTDVFGNYVIQKVGGGCGDQGWDCVDNLGCGSAGGWVVLTRELILVEVAVRCDAVGGRGWEADVLC